MPNLRHDTKLVFLYDALMKKTEQELAKIDLEFMSVGTMRGHMLHFQDGAKQFIGVTTPARKLVYGGIFLMPNYDIMRDRLASYYLSSTSLYGLPTTESFYVLKQFKVIPIKIKKLNDLITNKYKVGDAVDCIVPVLNMANPKVYKIANSTYKQRYYHTFRRIDTNNFIQMIKDNQRRKN